MNLLAILVPVAAALVAVMVWRPRLVTGAGGRALAFLALFVLPALVVAGGVDHHLERSKTTAFCVSCHVMEPYLESLEIADLEHLPAAHWQKRLVPRDKACYTCHRSYAMFGDLQAKVAGLKHMWVYYFGEMPEKIELYRPYQDRECLHCHEGARGFLESEPHEDAWEELRSGEITCLECHDKGHAIHGLADLERWTPGK